MRKNTIGLAVSLMLALGATGPVAAQQLALGATGGIKVVKPTALQSGPDHIAQLNAMIGKRVLGKSREFLGTLISVDGEMKTAQMKIPTGATLSLAAEKLSVEEDHLRAPTISRGDVLVMVRETGQAGTLEAGVLPKLPNPFKK